MGYRTFEPKPRPPRRTMQATATPLRIYLPNSQTSLVKIPCFYQIPHEPIRMKPHNRPMHDHLGWPDPRRRDRSCQLYEPYEAGYPPDPEHTRMGGHPPVRKLLDLARLIPIHFKDEGYESFEVRWSKSNPTSGEPYGNAFLDEEQDWVINLVVRVLDKTDPLEITTYKFSLWAENQLVTTGEVVLLPAAPTWKE